MKKYDLELTFNNIKETIINDPIGRRSYLFNFLKLLDAIDTETSISLDGDWGSGKTFFVKQAILCLQLTNKYLKDFYTDEEIFPSQKDCDDIKQVLGKQVLHDRSLIPVYFNAWKYDNFGEPVLALIYETINTFVNSGNFKGDGDIKNGILHIVKNIISSFKTKITLPSKDLNSPSVEIGFSGEKFSAIFDSFEEFKGPNYLKQFEEEDSIKEQIFKLFEKLCTERGDKFIIFIDELDRCKPSFAVSFLERIKHYFSSDRIIFVFSTNISELQNTIKAYYGNYFDGCGYLDKFFDIRLSLPEIWLERYLNFIGREISDGYLNNQLLRVISYYKLSMRNINRYLKVFDIAYGSYKQNEHSLSKTEQRTEFFCSTCLLPIMVYLMLFEKSKYHSFIDGKEADLFIDFMMGKEIDFYLRKFNELSKNSIGTEPGRKGVLRFVYEKILSISFVDNFYETCLTSFMTFEQNHKAKLLKSLTCLASLEEY